MRIDTSRLKKVTSEVSAECEEFIDRLRISNRNELLTELSQIETWTFGKCELYHWVDVLDAFDEILEDAAGIHDGNVWYLSCDNYSKKEIRLLLLVLKFTTLLIEHSFSRHLYNSIEHLTRLLTSNNMNIVLGVLNLLYMFSKRSNFISRLNITKKNALLARLNHIAESWGGKEHGFALAECCSSTSTISATASTFYFEYYNTDGALDCIEKKNLEKSNCHPAELTYMMCCELKDLDEDQKMHIFTRLRLSLSFERYPLRLKFVQARLQALSVLVYSNSLQDNIHTLLYPGFLEELVELLEMTDAHLVEIRAAALRTLTSIIHLDRNPHFPKKPGARLGMIIDVTGAAFYHGFLPTLVRTCINSLTSMTNLVSVPNQNHFDDDYDDEYDVNIDVDVNDKEGTVESNDLDIQKQQKILQQLQLKNSPPAEEETPKPQDFDELPNDQNNFPLPLATALFSFLYHLASYETGGEALVSCGMMESLLRVINWPGYELEHITFVTRAVRVIDLITNIEMQSFQNHGGLNSFIGRLDMEVNYCREEHPFEIEVQAAEPLVDETSSIISGAQGDATAFEGGDDNENPVANDDEIIYISDDENSMVEDNSNPDDGIRRYDRLNQNRRLSNDSDVVFVFPERETPTTPKDIDIKVEPSGSPKPDAAVVKTCLPQRAALLKSMLNFLKKAIQDQTFSDSIRHVMEGTLPNSLRHIISNAEYYGPSLFLLATDVVTVYVFQEPSFLSSLQNNGLTDVVLQALLKKDVPATREVLGSLPNVFSALCLNARGLEAFVKYDPFDRLFKVLLSPTYLMAMRRRRSSDPMGDTASNLGNAMDELMRHQPSLKPDSTKAVIKLLEELVHLGTDPKYICWRANNKHDFNNASSTLNAQSTNNTGRASNTNMGINNDAAGNSSDEDDDDEEEASTSSHHNQRDHNSNPHQAEQEPSAATVHSENSEREPVPLIDYILNVMKFVDAILSTNSTDDHCREFVDHGGLKPLISILALPNLPVDSPITTSAQAVASVCKSILNLAHEQMVLEVGLEQLSNVVDNLRPLQVHIEKPGGSVLLRELANCPNIDGAFSNASYTPLLHAMSAVHGYIVMLVHICRTGQMEIRNLLLNIWSKDTRSGKKLLKNLVELYTALVWESTLLLALCTDDVFPSDCEFGKEDLDKLPTDSNIDENLAYVATVTDASILPGLQSRNTNSMELDDDNTKDDTQAKKKNKLIATPGQLKYIKALLGASSRLGRALAELFGNLVKLCVGSPMRRRGQNFPLTPAFTSPEAKEIARVLSYILVDGFSHDKLLPSPIPKLKLTFLICSVGFTGPMLFDDKRYAFHLMLHKFVEEGGLEAFFEMFRWALTSGHRMTLSEALENQHFPDGTGEFLDAWLLLLEKMVNPKAILESPHIIINRTAYRTKPEFDIIMYLVKVHCLAFEAVIQIWGMKPLPTYGVRMTESMMSILKHVIKGERIIRDKYNKRSTETKDDEKPSSVAAPSTSNSVPVVNMPPLLTRTFSVVNSDHLRQLMDMGFSEQHATEALLRTMSMFEATEYLLCHPPPSPPNAIAGGSNTSLTSVPMEVDNNEITANQPRVHLQRHPQATQKPPPSNCGPCPASVKAARKLAKYKITMDPPMYEEILDEFCDTAIDKALYLMDKMPETIQKGTDLLVILYRRNPPCWRKSFLEKVCNELISWVDTIRKSMDNIEPSMRDVVLTGELATKFFVRLQLCSFLMDDMYLDMREMVCATINQLDCLGKIISCLLETEELLRERQTRTGNKITPKWLCQLLSFLDFVEKVNLITQRRKNMLAVTTRIWKWYDVASGKWNAYSVSNNKIIDQAYSNSDPSVRISCGRQRYTINFNCMSQVNEETGNHRPVILSLKISDKSGYPENIQRTEKKKQTVVLNTRNTDIISDTDSDDFNGQEGVNRREEAQSEDEPNASNNVVTPAQTPATASTEENNTNQECSIVSEGGARLTSMAPPTSTSQSQTITSPATRPLGGNGEQPKPFVKKRYRNSKENTNRPEISQTPQSPTTANDIYVDTEPVGLYQYDTAEIVTCCVRLMQPEIGIDRDTLHAIMKLCVRLTKDFENAKVFAKEGGVRLLLSMRQTCGYMGFPTFAILLIRHVLEEPKTLALAIERVIKARTIPTIPPGYRELLFLLRQMSSAVSRHPEIFKQVAHSMLRIDLSVLRRSTTINEDTRLMMKSEPPNPPKTETMDELVSLVAVHDLLKALVKPCVHYSSSNTFKHRAKQNSFSFQVLPGGGFIARNLTREQNGSTTSDATNNEPTSSTTDTSNKKAFYVDGNSEQCCGWHIPSPSHDHDKPLLPRATILKFLADAVRSYQTFAPLITKYIYKPEDSPLISENQTVLSFVLDRFLPIGEHTYDREVSSMTRVFISSLASCSDQPAVQTTVVMEVKAAIHRALALPESLDKHLNLQILAGLIPAMIENCPPDNAPLPSGQNKYHLNPRKNEIFYVMIRQDLISDLTKLIQYLDLSSPHSIATINAAMKPLEVLMRLTNAPGSIALSTKKSNASGPGSRRNRNHNTVQSHLISNMGQGSSGSNSGNNLHNTPRTGTIVAAAAAAAANAAAAIRLNSNARAAQSANLDELMDQLLQRASNMENELNVNQLGNNSTQSLAAQLGEHHFDNLNTLDVATSSDSDSDTNPSENDEREDDETANTNGNGSGGTTSGIIPSSSTANIIPVQYPVGVRIAMASPSSSIRSTSGVLHLVPGSSGVNMPNPVIIGSSANINTGVGIPTVVGANFNRRQHPVGGDNLSNIGIVDSAASASEITSDNDNARNSNGPSSIFRDATRVVLMDNAFGIFANTDEGSIDLVDQTGYLFGRSLAATLSSTPTALHWWLEEAKNLGMESQSDVCLVVAHELIPDLEEFKMRELLKLRLKRRKKQEEEAGTSNKDNSGIPLRVPQRNETANVRSRGDDAATTIAVERDIDDNIEFQPLQNNENFEQASGDNARDFVIGMDTDSEDNTQANQRTTNVRNTHNTRTARVNNAGDDSGGVSTNPATEAMSTTSTSEIVSEPDDNHRLTPMRFSSILPPLQDGNEEDDDEDDEDDEDDGDVDAEENGDDEDDEEDEENVLTSGDEGSEIDVVTTYITPSRTNQSLITNATARRRNRVGVTDAGIHIVTVTVGNSAAHSTSSGRIVTTGSSPRTLNDEMAAAALVPLPPDEDDDDEDDDDEDDDDGNRTMNFDDILSHVQRMNDESPPCLMHRPNRHTIINRSNTNRENSQNQTNENQEDRAVSGTSTSTSLTTASEIGNAAATASTSGTGTTATENAAASRELISAELREVLGDIEVPEGVDPSFLAALPQEMRNEVIAEHLRLQRIRQRAQQNAIRVEHASIAEVNPEFLAALPQNIQEEVLAQQRIEQQRQAAAAANPNDPVDTVAFFENLQPSLRQAILTDMEDSQISVLPPELAAEAQNLRRDWESRNRQIIQERLINQIGAGGNNSSNATVNSGGNNSSPMRYLYRRTGNVLTYLGSRFPTTNNVNVRPRWHTNSIWYNANNSNGDDGDQNNSSFMALMERQGRPLLDHEALSTLLVLLFVDDPKFHTLRLHRVIRNLCCHVPTREWIIKSLLSIIEKTNESRSIPKEETNLAGEEHPILRPNWLNIRLEGALGSRTNVFLIQRDVSITGPSSSSGVSTAGYNISIHSQAAQNVCKHSLDLLITLAKMFPKNFLPYMKDVPASLDQIATERMMRNATATGSRGNGRPPLLLPPPPCTSPTSNSSSTIYTFQTNTITNVINKPSSTATGAKQPSSTNLETDNTGSCSSSKMRKLNNSSSTSNKLDESMATESSPITDNSTSNLNKMKATKGALSTGSKSTDFWDIIIKLDCNTNQRKEAAVRTHSTSETQSSSGTFNNPLGGVCNGPKYSEFNSDFVSFDDSPFGQLIKMLSFGIVRRSTQLTDKLLRLLSYISVGLPDDKQMWMPHPSTSEESGRNETSTSEGHRNPSTSQPTSRGRISLSKHAFYYPNDRLKLTSVNRELLPTSERQLRLTIDVLTSKSCSEDGLEDATSLLLNMSQCSNQTRCIISNLLIRGAKELAGTVRKQIKALMAELNNLNPVKKSTGSKTRTSIPDDKRSPKAAGFSKQRGGNNSSTSKIKDGILQDRFTREAVVITAPTKVKQTCDLQLSSMVPLISRTSSQAFFLRVLKVIIQIREAVREAATKPEHRHRIVLSNNELTPLSKLLGLHNFWDTLSDGLLELEHSNDHHAVLVLQPAVEAFFLVHASQQIPTKKLRGFDPNADPEDDSAENNILPIDSLLVGFTEVDENPHITLESLPPDIPDIPEIPPFRGQRTSSNRPSVPLSVTTRSQRQRSERALSENDNETVVIVDSDSDDGDNDMAAQSEHTSGEDESTGNSRSLNEDDLEFNDICSDDDSSSTNDHNTKDFTFEDDQKKFINFAEKHRTVLNQILRQSSVHLSDGPFAVLVDHTRILDFDVKRKYFRTELERLDEGIRREELAVHVHRVTVFEDSFRELYRRNPEEWKNRFYIVFEDEEGQDAGGLLREWYLIISREIFNPMYALFTISPGDRVTYMINPSSHANPNHLCYYKFVGRVIAKAIHDNKLLECYFTRSFYKHILGIVVKYTDMESEDYDFYKGLVFLMENHISSLGYELTYSLEIQEFGVTEIRDLVPNGRNIPVTEENKLEYIHLVCQLKMSGSIRQQLNAFLEGFYDIIPKRLISIFNEQELELLISGLPNVDIEDLKANTEYNKYQANSIQIQWFWRALRSFDQADRAKFLQFITGTSKVPLQGFAALEGMNGTQKFQIHRDDRSTERLPSAHTCFNQLDLPAYKTYDKLRSNLLKAIHECSEGFGFA